MAREIKLTRGMVAYVDDIDYADLAKYKWTATPSNQYRGWRENPKWYAARWETVERRTKSGRKAQVKIYMHRQIAGCPPGYVVDHMDGDSLNNRRSNLCIATYQENALNRQGIAESIF